VHSGEAGNCEAMCGSSVGAQHRVHLLLHTLPRHHSAVQVTESLRMAVRQYVRSALSGLSLLPVDKVEPHAAASVVPKPESRYD
jgi:hypothetical protein